ncbi:MAG TPA: SpoIIE family protein phosphatase [Candidatus Dormibacteraeota bacterium]|nr:SpoIIE family protein phosphatase [Candidatus Dormibacteraeota bacterium]
MTGLTRRVVVREPADGGHARRTALQAAEMARFDSELQGRVSLIAAELSSNLLKHSEPGGAMLINSIVPDSGAGAVELVAIDRGPGMANVAAAFQDGYSSTGSLGVGLGTIRRHASHFEIHSAPDRGTAFLARVAADARAAESPFEVGVVAVQKDGEDVSGDGWAIRKLPSGIQLLVVDGLGHGLLAHDAAAVAVDKFRSTSGGEPVDVLRAIHPALRSSRGATASVFTVDTHARCVRYCGVGNIGAAVVTPNRSNRLVSLNGTVGREPVQFKQFEEEWVPAAVLVAHSDGLTTHWRLDQPGLLAKDPTLIAAVLFRDYARELDDVTVVVTRERPALTSMDGQ